MGRFIIFFDNRVLRKNLLKGGGVKMTFCKFRWTFAVETFFRKSIFSVLFQGSGLIPLQAWLKMTFNRSSPLRTPVFDSDIFRIFCFALFPHKSSTTFVTQGLISCSLSACRFFSFAILEQLDEMLPKCSCFLP